MMEQQKTSQEPSLPKVVRVLCLGAGVNSTALLILRVHNKVNFDIAIFADTGGEHPETYDYLNHTIKPFCERNKIELAFIKSEKPPLYDFYLSKKIIPVRIFRHCTDHYKIQPLKKFCMKKFPTQNIVFLLGIDAGEKKRIKNQCGNFEYPLIELGLDREACKKLIMDEGLAVPQKSGCYFCPFTKKEGWINLLTKHRNLYLKAETLEKNNQRYPEIRLTSLPLEKIRLNKDLQRSLCSFGMESCVFCEVES